MLSNLLLSPCFPAKRLVPRPSIRDQRRPSDGDSGRGDVDVGEQ
ncbi:hypothetical protein V6Z11_A13G145400 [Gossypium hirsutum]